MFHVEHRRPGEAVSPRSRENHEGNRESRKGKDWEETEELERVREEQEHPNCVVAAVSDQIPERRESLKKKYLCDTSYESLEVLFSN